MARLDRVVPELLRREGPLDATQLKARLEIVAPNHDGLFGDWLRSALTRQLAYEQPRTPKTKAKTYAAESPPADLGTLLKRPLADLKKLLPSLEQKGVSRERIAAFLCAELGLSEGFVAAATEHAATDQAALSPASSRLASSASRDVFMEALRRFAADNPKGALLPVRELRARAGLAKQDFDAAALALSREGLLVLHHHDHAASLSEADQNALVRDALGRHYIGVALRGLA